jgi:formylglycine-generating enzyme required for sulfatase activity
LSNVQAQAPWLTPTTSRIFFGTAQSADVFDDVAIRPLSAPTNAPPTVFIHPSDQQALAGTTVTLDMGAYGAEPLHYQWRFNGTNLTDATTDILTLSNVQKADAGAYEVVVANDYGSVTNRVAVLTVLLKPREITTQPTHQSVLSGSSVSLSVLAIGSLPMTYQWLRNGRPLSDGNRIAGASTATLTITVVGIEDVGVYSVAVDNEFGSATSLPVALDVIMAAPRITGQSRSQAARLGSTVSLDVQATGSQPLSFQWQCGGVDMVDGPRVSGSRASTLQITSLSLSDLGSYSVIVSNALGWVQSASLELTTWSEVLFAAAEASHLVVTWNDAGKGMTLQRTGSPSDPKWEDVAESEGTNAMRFPMTNAAAFFRLAMRSPSDRLVWIPPGIFTMGSPTNEVDRSDNEGPQTAVAISRGFWMGKYEVTQGEYEAVMGSNPSHFTGNPNRPVEQVSWDDATNYCGQLAQRERAAGRILINSVYRLPTEAEWEYACRAGTTTRFSYGDDPGYTNLTNYAWYDGNSGGTTHPVGQKLPNSWGLHDMHGNVWEWCQDWRGPYPGGIVIDPQGPATGEYRVLRSGGWGIYGLARGCRSADRGLGYPDTWVSYVGFRVVLAPGQA